MRDPYCSLPFRLLHPIAVWMPVSLRPCRAARNVRFGRWFQPVTATPRAVYRQAFRIPRSPRTLIESTAQNVMCALPKSGHVRCNSACPLWANNGHHNCIACCAHQIAARLDDPPVAAGNLFTPRRHWQGCLVKFEIQI